MSDFGDGDYDDFEDDFHEMLYDADPNPDLADDLAEHTLASPLWQDNPTEELRDYFSDWEYYSDDYFDDDPGLLHDSQGIQQSRKRKADNLAAGSTRKRKRNLSETREQPDLKRHETEALRGCLRGTVWKADSPDRTVIFHSGPGDMVALRLSDEVMRAAYSRKHGFGKQRRKEDESWANDLSLADMGLKPERSMSMNERQGSADLGADEDGFEEDEAMEDLIEDEIDEDQNDVGVEEEALQTKNLPEGPDQLEIWPELVRAHEEGAEDKKEHHSKSKKRRKPSQALATEENTLPTPDASLESDTAEVSGQATKQTAATAPSKGGGRKRKLSMSSATASTASSRAKRVAVSTPKSEDKGVLKTAAASRPARSRKKDS